MSSEDVKAPSRRSLVTAATAAALLAAIVIGYGFMNRAQSKQEVVQWTSAQAIPTVALAQPIPGGTHQTLTLPGNIQPFNRAAIFSRVNGYVKSWDHDNRIARQGPGKCWPPSMLPISNQQLGQAKATLASVRANHQLASLTASRNNILLQKQIVASSLRTRPPPTRRRRRPWSTPMKRRAAAGSHAIVQDARRAFRRCRNLPKCGARDADQFGRFRSAVIRGVGTCIAFAFSCRFRNRLRQGLLPE